MSNPLNREKDAVLPNVVPASFTPVPEQYAIPVTQELRTRQAQMVQGYALSIINGLEQQLHLGWYKRLPKWQAYPEAQSTELLIEAIRIAKTARTLMKDKITEWAGNYSEQEMEAALPDVWNKFVQIVQGPAEEAEETEAVSVEVETEMDEEENALAPEDMAPAVVDRPEIPGDAPKSEVVAPDEISLGDVLGKISEDNTKD